MKTVAIIGSTGLQNKMKKAAQQEGINFLMPCMDEDACIAIDIMKANRANIEQADEIWVFWDGRSQGTILDLGMAFALRKKIRIKYLEEKTIVNILKEYTIEGDIPEDERRGTNPEAGDF